MDRKRHKRCHSGNRLHITCFNVIFSCVILIAANSLASGHFTEKINKISHNLNKSLGAVLDIPMTNYTSIYENITYASNNTFNPKGMGVLYKITTKFMGLIASKDVYPEGFIKVENHHLKLGSVEEQWQSILSHYGALLAVLIILLLFLILMPLCGFFFCCCRCCGKCGARSKPFDKKGDLCKKICLASLLICAGTLLLFGVVCAFVTNQTLQDNTLELSPSLKNSVDDTDTYLMYAGRQVHVLLTINYKEFEGSLFSTLDQCSDIVLEQLGEYSNATSLTEVVELVNSLDDIKQNLTFVGNATKMLRTKASQLTDGLRKVRGDLLNILKDCSGIPECDSISNDYISELNTDIDFDKLPDIDDKLKNLSELMDKGIVTAIKQGQQAFDGIRNEINHTVSSNIPKVKQTIQNVGIDIVKQGENISSIISKTANTVHRIFEKPVNDMDKYIKDYTPYRYYLGIAVSCILLLVSLCITLGLICGICGKRPDAYGDDCCNKGAGSRFLMIGVAIMFLFSIILAAVAIVYFFTGVLAQRLVCDSLRNPKDNQVVQLIDQVFNLKQSVGVNVNISWALTAVHSNKSLYHAFELKDYIDLDDVNKYMDEFEITETLEELKKNIIANTNGIVLINEDAENCLLDLKNSGIDSINYDAFIEELQHALTTVNLTFLADKLDQLVETVKNHRSNRKDIATSLLLSSLHLRTYQANLVIPMTDTSNHLIEVLNSLKSSFSSATIDKLIIDLKETEKYLQVNGTSDLIEIADSFGTGLEKQVRAYLDRTIIEIRDNIGMCGPLSNVFNSTLVATCDKILLPWNGFWFSILWCLILFIPTIILSVKLAGLYQKYEAYPGPLVEASMNDKRYKKKKKHKRFDGRGAYVAEAAGDHGIAREVPSGSARYSDMAPKHWEEFPAGGPPHYQRAPTEYERPPPYYYPGAEQ